MGNLTEAEFPWSHGQLRIGGGRQDGEWRGHAEERRFQAREPQDGQSCMSAATTPSPSTRPWTTPSDSRSTRRSSCPTSRGSTATAATSPPRQLGVPQTRRGVRSMARVRLSWYVGAIHGCTPVCFAVLAAVLVVGFPLYLTCNITSRLDPCLANHYDTCCAAVRRWLLLCLLKTIAIVQILMLWSYLCNLCLLCPAIVCEV
jgi:hypothetical protein